LAESLRVRSRTISWSSWKSLFGSASRGPRNHSITFFE
jgi:hypothetical protein